jgi:hypothetical protein
MGQSEICEPVQALAGATPQQPAANQSPSEGAPGPISAAEQVAPIAADAPGLAPVDAPAGLAEPVTIDLEPGRAGTLAHWIPPAPQGPRMGKFSAGAEQECVSSGGSWKLPRIARLAAVIALAIGAGAVAGSLGTLWVMHAQSSDQTIALNETNQLKAAVERLNTDLVALRSSLEASNRGTSAQFSRLADRLERTERAQAEPAAKIAKLNETLERIDRRTRDIPEVVPSASIPEQRVPPPVPIKEISRVSVVPGWVVRSVYDGTALIQGRIGMIEVEVGDPLPGGGRVEAIRRQDGRWVVVTSKGLILAAQ